MMLNLFVTGFGLGLASNACLMAAQHAVGWERRGVVTASVQFSRTIGGTLGIAIARRDPECATRARPCAQVGGADVNALLSPAARGA